MEDGLEAELRRRHAVREERFAHRGWEVDLLLPRAADLLIDEAEFAADERLPYWAELWPSARALARHLLDAGGADRRPVLELGCGLALPSLALRSLGVPATASDWYPDALRFAAANALRNGLGRLDTAPLDWRHPPEGMAFSRLLAADVLYEARNAALLAALLPRIAAPGAVLLLADPGRVYAPDFLLAMERAGWTAEQVDERMEPSAENRESRVRIHRLEAPA
jgi:predicted nicotinamide N-methyase